MGSDSKYVLLSPQSQIVVLISQFFCSYYVDVEQKANCIKSLLTEQRELSLQAASHSLSAIHLKQRLNIYHRYFIALARFKSTKNDDCYSDTIEGQVDVSYQVRILTDI